VSSTDLIDENSLPEFFHKPNDSLRVLHLV